MAPAIIPTPLTNWQKWALEFGATPSSYVMDLLSYLGSSHTSEDPAAGEWRHVQIIWDDVSSGLPADAMVTTLDLSNITGGGLDSTWTSADYTTCDGILTTLVNAWGGLCDDHVHSREIRYYKRLFNPYSNPKPFAPSGPPEHVLPLVVNGTQPQAMPHQVAFTHTEKTTFPKHWGRSYWPAFAAGSIVAGGLVSNTVVDSWCTAVHTAYAALGAAEFFPTVPTTQVDHVPMRMLLGVTSVQVDNVADVIRSRRRHTTTYRKVLA
jgi:hypothetical protein